MQITELRQYKGNTWMLRLNEKEELHFLHVSIVKQFHLCETMTLPESAWEEVQTAELSRKAYQHACYLLDYRDYSYQEMFRRLEPKYPEDVCYTVTDRLAKNGLLNDRKYAEQLARHYVEGKRYGFRRARQEMRRRGLLDAQIEEALELYEDGTEERLQALLVRKYQKYFLDPDDCKMVEKGKAALVRQGYGFSEINAAVRWFLEENEE